MQATRIISTVLPNGSIVLPKEFAKEAGNMFEVILIPMSENNIYSYAQNVAKKRKIPKLSEFELSQIIHDSRKVK